METLSGANNWRMVISRSEHGVTILKAQTCDETAALPERLFDLPVTALGDHALTPGRPAPEGETVLLTCGPENDAEHWDNGNLRELTLPRTLLKAGDYALLNCASLRTLHLEDSIRFWGSGALMNCRLLDRIFLHRSDTEGENLAYFADELSRELDVTVTENGQADARLIFPEYVESYEENSPAHHFDYTIYGPGYPYHHCFRNRKLLFSEYDGLWPAFLSTEHDDLCALRLAFYRLNSPRELSDEAVGQYREYLHAHAGEALRWLLTGEDTRELPLLLREAKPSPENLSAACELARRNGKAETVALLLEEQHRLAPAGLDRSFDL